MNWLLDALPNPRILVLPPAAADLGEAEAAIELWEHYSRKRLDPTQRLVVQVMMALGPDGRWAAGTTGREMPRQNGKGDEIEVVELWGLVQRGEAIAHTIHDAVLLASQTQQRMLGVLEAHSDLSRLVKRKWLGTGQQMIEMRNGGVIWYRTRTNGGLRGADYIDRLVVDEAQHATPEQLAATSPALLANPNSQLNATGTSGLDGMSRWWWDMRIRALSPDPGAFGYVGHTTETVSLDEDGKVAREPVDSSDRSLWASCNPFLLAGRGGGVEFLEEQFRRLGPALFAQEHLGVWGDPPGEDTETPKWTTITQTDWDVCGEDFGLEQPGWLTGPVTLAVEVDGDRAAWICVAGDRGDRTGGDVVAQGPGTSWVEGHLRALTSDPAAVKRIVIDRGSEAGSLIDPLRAAGLEITEFSTSAVVKATGQMIDAVTDKKFCHRRRPSLTDAAAAAVLRRVGSAHAIDRTGSAAPFIGVTLARAAHMQQDDPPKGKQPGRYW